MARKRTSPQTKTEKPTESATETSGKTKKVKYTGPPGQVVLGVGELKPGESYELPEEMADGLVAGSPHWE